MTPQPGWGRDWVSGTCIVRFAISADGVEGVLAQKGIETRRWWGNGLLAHPAFAGCPTLALPVTERLAATTLGLPCHGDLTDEDIARIGAAVALVQAVTA